MADKVLKDLEGEITASTKMLGSLSQQIENINVSINKILAGLQAEYKKTKRQEIDDLEVQENALESQYLDLRKKLFEAKHKWRVTLANILEAESKGKKGSDPTVSSQYVTVTHSTLLQETTTDPALDLDDDEDDTAHLAGFGGWEIEDSELKLGTDTVPVEKAKLGSGSFGTVYRGMCRGKEVAVKVLRTTTLDESSAKEFKRECQTMSALKHPNLLLFMGACTQPGKLKIVTELAANGSVEDVLKDKSIKVSFHRKMKIARETAAGMNWLHCMKPSPLLHLDLKTANLLLTSDFKVKIADFGLSRLKDDKMSEKDKMNTGGTPLYMPPEMFQLKPETTEKCDVYAFGVILWELFTEKRPYEGKYGSIHQLIDAVSNRNERPEIPENCPKKLRQLIERCWHKDPKQRPSFQEILDSKVFDDIILEAVTQGNEACQQMWKNFGTKKKEVAWDTFLQAFLKLIKAKSVSEGDIRAQCLAAVLDVDKHPQRMVTLDAFEKFLKWFGPVQGPEILDQIKSLLEEKWFHGELNAKEAEAKIISGKRGAYLIRFSSQGGYSITFIDKKKKILHYRIPDSQKYDLQKFVKVFSKQHHLNAPVSPRIYDQLFAKKEDKKEIGGYLSSAEAGELEEMSAPVNTSTIKKVIN
eukprot:TRINITY_DN620_c0_g1_i1.p1 TRINITY_DN620_c0_g1~~TRINITY_DN620_c0_g1_i1.p1  ORF type:complete len:642 (-),score=178.52 TRINITY_DN620_c0_g1_i1:124-2049(-)